MYTVLNLAGDLSSVHCHFADATVLLVDASQIVPNRNNFVEMSNQNQVQLIT